MESLRFEQASASDSIAAYEAYLKLHADGSGSTAARNRLRELSCADARQRKTVAAFEAFLARYTEGKDADSPRRELPAIEVRYKAWQAARREDTVDSYQSFLADYPDGTYADEARARLQIRQFNSTFGISAELTEELLRNYLQQIENETYATSINTDLEYYAIKGGGYGCKSITKERVIVKPSQVPKACALQLKAGELTLAAIYVSTSSSSPVGRPLFARKWRATEHHNGCAGPGLEFRFDSAHGMWAFEKYLTAFSIPYNDSFRSKFVVVPDLLWRSHEFGGGLPNYGASFGRDLGVSSPAGTEPPKIDYEVEGVEVELKDEGFWVSAVTTYEQALALKSYLRILSAR